MIFKKRSRHYLLVALALLNTFVSTINAQDLDEGNEVQNMIAEDTADVISRIVGTGERMKRSGNMYYLDNSAEEISKNEETKDRPKRSDELLSQEDTAQDISNNEGAGARVKRSKDKIHNLKDDLANEDIDETDESMDMGHLRKRRSNTHVKRLLDDLDESKRKRSSEKDFKNRLAIKKRNANKEKKNHEMVIIDSAEDQAEKRKIKRKAREEIKRLNSKKGKKRSSKKEKKHVGARCTEQSACNSCQTTTEEFTLPTTTESECCETKPKCKPTTTKCKTTTTPCDSCDTCRLRDEEQDNQQQ